MTRHFLSLCTLTLASTMFSALVIAAPINVVYVNGIQNTLEEANDTQLKIQSILLKSQNHIGDDKRVFAVKLVWNPVGWYGNKNGNFDFSQDLQELFLLKTAEEKYAADFGLILAPHDQTRIIDKAAATRVAAYIDDMTPGNNSLETSGEISDSAMARTQLAVRTLVAVVQRLKSAVIVGHSEGNLLANLAFASIAATQGNDIYKSVRVVNVANTSEFAVSGLNFTHAGDAALFSAASATFIDLSLETLPKQKGWTRTTPACRDNRACNFTIAPATFGMPTSAIPDQGLKDKPLDHSIYETYLSTATVPIIDSQGVSLSPTAIGFVDRFEDFIYAAALSLETSQGVTAGSTVQSASCTLPVVGTLMTCSVTGTNLPVSVSMTATNCSPASMDQLFGGTSARRQFTCSPSAIGGLVSIAYIVPGFIGALPPIRAEVAIASTAFYDSFEGSVLDTTKWMVSTATTTCCGPGNPAVIDVSGGYLNVAVPGGSCGACGVGDGSVLRPVIPPLGGDFEITVSAEEIERLRRDNHSALSVLALELNGGNATLGVYIRGDVKGNTGVAGHSIELYSNVAGALDYLNITELTVGRYYSFEFRVRRVGSDSFIAFRLANELNWTEFIVRQSIAASVAFSPKILFVSGDGSGTIVNSSFKSRLASVTIK